MRLEVEVGGGRGFGDLGGFGDGLAGEGVGAFDGDCFFGVGGWRGGGGAGVFWGLRGGVWWMLWCCSDNVFCCVVTPCRLWNSRGYRCAVESCPYRINIDCCSFSINGWLFVFIAKLETILMVSDLQTFISSLAKWL